MDLLSNKCRSRSNDKSSAMWSYHAACLHFHSVLHHQEFFHAFSVRDWIFHGFSKNQAWMILKRHKRPTFMSVFRHTSTCLLVLYLSVGISALLSVKSRRLEIRVSLSSSDLLTNGEIPDLKWTPTRRGGTDMSQSTSTRR